ncbi:MAG: hypothetical protein LIR50_17625 [Bacillota bacterium]|nr:hypothetical protein [Bacillota bacterium]
MWISKEENITQIIDGITLSTFNPRKEEIVVVTINPDKIDLDCAKEIYNIIDNFFINNKVILKLDGITLEAMYEDDLK